MSTYALVREKIQFINKQTLSTHVTRGSYSISRGRNEVLPVYGTSVRYLPTGVQYGCSVPVYCRYGTWYAWAGLCSWESGILGPGPRQNQLLSLQTHYLYAKQSMNKKRLQYFNMKIKN